MTSFCFGRHWYLYGERINGREFETFQNVFNLITSLLKRKRTFYFDLLEHPVQPTQFKQFNSIHQRNFLCLWSPDFSYNKSEELAKILYVKERQKILLKMKLEMKMFIYHFQKLKRNKVYYKFRKDIYAGIFSQLIKHFKQKIDEYISEKMRGSCLNRRMKLSICLLNS